MSAEPLVVISHPLADNRPDEVSRKASAIADELVSVLTENAETLAERYRSRFAKPVERRIEAAVVCTDEACIADVDRGPSRR